MLNDKASLILQLVNQGRAEDILALIEGESPYTTEDSEGTPKDKTLAKLWVCAVYHLRFISELGINSPIQVKDGRVESPFPDDFMQWLEADAPGIGFSDLLNYLSDNPF